MLRAKYFIIVCVCLVACRAEQPAEKADRIVIICDHETVYTDTIYLTDDRSEESPAIVSNDPVIFSFRNNTDEGVPPISVIESDTITILSTADYSIVKYRYNPIEALDFVARNGDTVRIDNRGDFPEITATNRASWGIDYEHRRDTRFGRTHGYALETIVTNPSLLYFISPQRTDVEAELTKITEQLQVNDQNESLWLDSLYTVRLLDSIEYRYYKSRENYQHLFSELGDKTTEEMKNILSSYSDSTYRNDFYGFYPTYYNAVAGRYYFTKTIQLSNGMDYDFKYAYDRIERDTLLSGRLRDNQLFYCFQKIDEIFSITDGKAYYDRALGDMADTVVLNALHRDYDKFYAQEIVFNDDLTLQGSDGATTTLNRVIAANAGRVVYVDFWASWCAPCMAAMPAAKALREDYRTKDVVFVYLALNDKEEAWKKAIPKAGLSDVREVYFVTNSRTNTFTEKLKITTIPRYLIYDKRGQIVNSNAPGPNSKEIEAELNKHLR